MYTHTTHTNVTSKYQERELLYVRFPGRLYVQQILTSGNV